MGAPENPVIGVFDRAAATHDRVGVEFFQPIADELVRHALPDGRAVAPGGTAPLIDASAKMT